MTLNKTQPTAVGADVYIGAIADEGRREDCAALSRLMSEVSKHDARMWGSAIVGFGVHRYALAGGKDGVICAVGFSSRKADISIYGVAGESADRTLLARLGKHKHGKGCLYVRRLSDVDIDVLRQLIADAIERRSS